MTTPSCIVAWNLWSCFFHTWFYQALRAMSKSRSYQHRFLLGHFKLFLLLFNFCLFNLYSAQSRFKLNTFQTFSAKFLVCFSSFVVHQSYLLFNKTFTICHRRVDTVTLICFFRRFGQNDILIWKLNFFFLQFVIKIRFLSTFSWRELNIFKIFTWFWQTFLFCFIFAYLYCFFKNHIVSFCCFQPF